MDMKSAMQHLADGMGLSPEEMRKLVEAVMEVDVTPKMELMHRLNLRVQDIDPGPSINWPGDRAILELWDYNAAPGPGRKWHINNG